MCERQRLRSTGFVCGVLRVKLPPASELAAPKELLRLATVESAIDRLAGSAEWAACGKGE